MDKKENVGEEIQRKEEVQPSRNRSFYFKWIKKIMIGILLTLCFLGLCAAAATVGFVVETIKEVPTIEPTEMNSLLNQHSILYDAMGEEFEEIQTIEFRDIIEFHKIPSHLKEAFIAIEDERFQRHKGIDFKRIVGALLINIKERSPSQGASTITQQLIKNLYLQEEVDRENLVNDLRRKIKEAYLAIQVEKALTKDQILHVYLNTINLGQGAYGVQEAAKTYFDKNVEDLTIGESALIAGITKNPSKNAPYILRLADDVEENHENLIGYMDLIGNHYAVLYNPNSVTRQRIVLNKMKELAYITEEEYQKAMTENIKEKLRPREKENTEITTFFSDLAKKEVVEILMAKGLSKKEAEMKLYTGGLRIYTTIDVAMQKRIEDVYKGFGEILVGNLENRRNPILIEWGRYRGNVGNLDQKDNLVDHRGNILYFKKENLIKEEGYLIIEETDYYKSDDGLEIQSPKIHAFDEYISLKNFYSIDEKKNLVLHEVGNLQVDKRDYFLREDHTLVLSNEFLKNYPDFYKIDEIGNLCISPKYFTYDAKGIVQPQSALVIIEHHTGKIRGMLGGREVSGRKILNRAVEGYRQPGSTIKPLSVYLPALDNGYTAASVIDDLPHYDGNGRLWPRNWYNGYRGLTSLRGIATNSMNIATVKLLKEIGIETSINYLTRLGIINEEDPSKDSFVTMKENSKVNDENLASLGLGGLTKGISPLTLTAAYAAIANDGVYIRPTTIEKILDSQGDILYQYTPQKTFVVSREIANIMTDILKDVIHYGTGTSASLYPGNQKIPVAGKTGTTTAKADAWFVGYSPYYSAALWIGNDLPQLNLTEGSRLAAIFWREIMLAVHEGLEDRDFEVSEKLIRKNIDIDTGKLPTALTYSDPRGNRIRTEIFAPETLPTDSSDMRVQVKIDKNTNQLATPYCPEEDVELRSLIKTNPPYYDPAQNGGRLPDDFAYRVPKTFCHLHYEGWVNEKEEEEN